MAVFWRGVDWIFALSPAFLTLVRSEAMVSSSR